MHLVVEPCTPPAPETGGWQQINSTVYELTTNERGEQVNRWSANVQGPRLRPGESEEIAARIIADHAAVPRLVRCVQDLLGVITHLQDQNAVTWPDEKEKIRWAESILALTALRRKG
jgi:hypothetical protein